MMFLTLMTQATLIVAIPSPQSASVYIEQISVAARRRTEAPRQIPVTTDDPKRAVPFSQLPQDLQQSNDANENDLASKSSPEATLTADVLRAWSQIRGRGQTPTPDLIAREIGPDRLAEFLATTPAAANVLATGTLPDAQEANEPKAPATEPGQ